MNSWTTRKRRTGANQAPYSYDSVQSALERHEREGRLTFIPWGIDAKRPFSITPYGCGETFDCTVDEARLLVVGMAAATFAARLKEITR